MLSLRKRSNLCTSKTMRMVKACLTFLLDAVLVCSRIETISCIIVHVLYVQLINSAESEDVYSVMSNLNGGFSSRMNQKISSARTGTSRCVLQIIENPQHNILKHSRTEEVQWMTLPIAVGTQLCKLSSCTPTSQSWSRYAPRTCGHLCPVEFITACCAAEFCINYDLTLSAISA